MKSVAFVVLNNVMRDVRVLKEAESLANQGYKVDVYGIHNSANNVGFIYKNFNIFNLNTALHTKNMYVFHMLFTLIVFFPIIVLILSGLIFLIREIIMEFSVKKILLINMAGGIILLFAAALFLKRKWMYANILSLIGFARYVRGGYWGQNPVTGLEDSSVDVAKPVTAGKWAGLRSLLNSGNRQWVFRLAGIQRGLYLHLRSRNYDIVHCHDFTALPVGIALKEDRPEIKLVYDSHELFSAVTHGNEQRKTWIQSREKAYAPLIDACITVNDSIAQILKAYYPQLPTPVVVCNATPQLAELPTYDGRLHAAANLSPDTKILLFQGGFADHRGLGSLLGSAINLKPGWAIVFMGWGTYEKRLLAALDVLATYDPNVMNRVRFLPPVGQNDLPFWTAGAALGAIPYEPVSLNHIYCSPNKLWEYPRSRVPILCSDVPEMRKRVQQYGYGWLIPPMDLNPTGIAAIVNDLSDDDLERARNACDAFISADNWSIYERRLIDVYKTLAPPT